ncbi:MAG TPA: hypothetical protein VHG09_06085 [Longimicrobiales bacterium]|nr:hypothetical protein [Longimicrobiales bacterium]
MNLNDCLRAVCTTALLSTACAMPDGAECLDAARLADLPASLDEASGMALSRRDAAVLWAHNDSEGAATLYALDRSGRMLAEIPLPRAGRQFDWEDIAAGPCPAGDCLYIGDIGDNLHNRDDRAILRIAEPPIDASGPVTVERYPISYPDGPVDAEALFVTRDMAIYIITKGRRDGITLYRYPPPLRSGERVQLERIQQLKEGVAQVPDLVTGADAAPDGERIAVRTYSRVTIFRFDNDTLVTVGAESDITSLGEPQGEAVTFAGGDTLLLATEAGPAREKPFISAVTCSTH